MAETFARLADRLMNSGDEGRHIFRTFYSCLNHSKFVTAQPCNDILLIETILKARRHGFQKLIAYPMPERVVDAFEFVDVNVEQSHLLSLHTPRECRFAH